MFNFGKSRKKRAYTKRKDQKEENLTNEKSSKEKSDAKSEIQEKKIWGKWERYVVLGTLTTTILISGVLAVSARSWKLPNLPRLVIPGDVFEETFVIESQKKAEDNNEIISEFSNQTKSLSGIYGFAIVNLEDGAKYGKFQKEEFQAASLIKLPLMTYVYELAEDNLINLDSIHTLTDSEKIGGSGSLFYEEEGTVRTIRQLVEAMGKESDNTAFNILKNKVGEDKLQEYIFEIGMKDTFIATNETTVSDVSDFFVKLWQNRLVNSTNKLEILEFLTDTIYENYIPSQIPEEISIAHKYGRELHVINDAGIVFSDSPFVIVILTKGIVEKEAEEIFPRLARILYDYEVQRSGK